MKRLVVTFLAVSLLAVAHPAGAQFADPVGLFATGAVVPFLASGSNLSILELLSPISANSLLPAPPAGPGTPNAHLIFFNDACTKGESVDIPVTTNDSELLSMNSIVNYNGLVVIAASANGLDLLPVVFPMWARVHWFDVANDTGRVFETISVLHGEAVGAVFWNPLRTAHGFFAPPEGSTFHTTLYFVCPNATITGKPEDLTTAAVDAVSPLIAGAPFVPTATGTSNGVATTIRGVVYDDEEKRLRDFETPCNCLTARPLLGLSSAYTDTILAPNGTYTEIRGGTGNRSFTGYEAIHITDGLLVGGQIDDWHRLSNAEAARIFLNP